MTAVRVCYHRNPTGYEVQVLDEDGQPVYEHQGGNFELESTQVVSPDSALAVSQEKLLEFAETTARELAEEHGLDPDSVIHDVDAENEAFDDPAYAEAFSQDTPRPR